MSYLRATSHTRHWLRVIGTASWLGSVAVWAIQLGLQLTHPLGSWLLDWHVYAAAGGDLLQGTLYKVGLVSPYPIPVQSFNYPPLSALAAVPLLPLPDQLAGVIWVVLNVSAVAATALLTASILGVRPAPVWAGIGFAAYTVHPWAWYAVLGNNSPIVLLVVALFLHQHLRGRSRTAGALLGVAIGMKIWPVALVPLLIREGRWRTLASTASFLLAVAVGFLLWLGPGAVGAAFAALQIRDEVDPGNTVLGITWLRETIDWWPTWGGYAVAAGLLVIPVRGRSGLGLGILAGMAAVPNLWAHYLPTVILGFLLIVSGLACRRLAATTPRAVPSHQAGRPQGEN